ncbi:MAG: galactokinase [Candidatus Kryptoniota bacterium]
MIHRQSIERMKKFKENHNFEEQEQLDTVREAKKELYKLFRTEFGRSPDIISSAPGRINLMGEHTDYNDGFVLPVAIDRRTYTAAGRRGGRLFIAFSKELGKKTSFEITPNRFEHTNFWANYLKGAALLLSRYGLIEGTNFAIASTVPRGSGLSSSTAFVVSVVESLIHLYNLNVEKLEIPKIARQIENDFVGVQSGIMDPFVATFAKANTAILLDTRSLQYEYIPFPKDLSILVCVTGLKRALANTEYNRRKEECQQAVKALSKITGRKITSLRDVTHEDLADAINELPPLLYRRATHIITENERVHQMADALRQNNLTIAGKLMIESHLSLRSNYEVSSRELDSFVEVAEQLYGVYGARMTGAGFGGSVVCLADSQVEEELTKEILQKYKERGFESGSVFIARTGSGLQIEH